MTIKGKIRTVSPQQFQLDDGFRVYTIDREKLGFSDQEDLKKAKVGAVVTLQIPTTAIALAVRNPAKK